MLYLLTPDTYILSKRSHDNSFVVVFVVLRTIRVAAYFSTISLTRSHSLIFLKNRINLVFTGRYSSCLFLLLPVVVKITTIFLSPTRPRRLTCKNSCGFTASVHKRHAIHS